MKRKMSLAVLILFLISALGFYVFAQSQATAHGTLPPLMNVDVALCNADAVMLHKSFPSTGTLRAEMKDGTVQQINLSDVKMLTLRDWESNFRH